MDFSKTPPELAERFLALIPAAPDITHKKLFGYPACFINGNMFAGMHGHEMILRLPDGEREKFIEEAKTHLFEPMPGRPMKEYVIVPEELFSGRISSWLITSLSYARSLPPKQKK